MERPLQPDSMDEDGAAECLEAPAHPRRFRLVTPLLDGRYRAEVPAESTAFSPSVTSEHHLLLERCGSVRSEGGGTRVFHSLAEALLGKIVGCVRERFAA